MTQRRTGGADSRRQAVIFDFDGTIADSMLAVVEVFEDLTKRHDRFTPEQVEEMRELSVPQLMKQLHIPAWRAPMLLMRGRRMMREHLQTIALHKGMSEALKALHEQGLPLYVVSTNSTENVRAYLRRHGLLEYFTEVHGGASLLGKAPVLRKVLKEHDLDVHGSWYVGDEIRDINAARLVRLRIASVTWGFNSPAALAKKRPDALVKTPVELVSVLKRSWKK